MLSALQELTGREYEYLSITRDTTEADIKQRREIQRGTAYYTDLVCDFSIAVYRKVP